MNIVNEVRQKADDAQQEVNKVDVPLTRRLGLMDLLKQTFKQVGQDHVGAFAGNLAYRALFAMFPFLLFLLSLLGLFHATGLVDAMIKQAGSAMPSQATILLKQTAHSVTKSHASTAFGVSAAVSMLLALWGVSGGFRAVMDAMNVMYNVNDKRPFWKKYAISIALALVISALMLTAITLLVFGPAIGGGVADRLGLGSVFTWVWTIVQWPVLLVFVLLSFALIYFFAPDVKQDFRFISPGAIIGLSLWVIFSLLFSLYVNNFGSYNKTYGTLAGLAIFLLYMYYSAFIVLMGAEMNQVIEQNAPGGKQPGQKSSPATDDNSHSDNRTLQILEANRAP